MAVSKVKNPDGSTTSTLSDGSTLTLPATGDIAAATFTDPSGKPTDFKTFVGAVNARGAQSEWDSAVDTKPFTAQVHPEDINPINGGKAVLNAVGAGPGSPPDLSGPAGAESTFAAQIAKQAAAAAKNPATAPQVSGGAGAANTSTGVSAAQQRVAAAQAKLDQLNANQPIAGEGRRGREHFTGTNTAAQDQELAAWQAQQAAAQKELDDANAALASAQTQSAPYAAGAGPISVPTLSSSTPQIDFKPTLQTSATQVDPGAVSPISATPVWTPTGVQAGTVSAQQIGPMSLQGVPGDITLEGTGGRTAQTDALSLLRGAANGAAPSAAEQLLRKGIDEGVGAQYGLAAALQGRNPGSALYQASRGAADVTAKSSADMAALRADEMATARRDFGSLGTNVAGQDLSALATNQGKNLQVSTTNLNAGLEIAKSNQGASLSADQGNQTADLNAQIATQTAKLDASKADAANKLAADIQSATNQLSILQKNQQTLLEAGEHDQADALNSQIANLTAQISDRQKDQQSLLDAAKTSATLQQQNSQFNAGQASGTNTTNAQLQLQQQHENNAYQLALLGLDWNAIQGMFSGSIDMAKIKAAYDAGASQLLLGGANIAAHLAAAP